MVGLVMNNELECGRKWYRPNFRNIPAFFQEELKEPG
jgi:hypothetical protein